MINVARLPRGRKRNAELRIYCNAMTSGKFGKKDPSATCFKSHSPNKTIKRGLTCEAAVTSMR